MRTAAIASVRSWEKTEDSRSVMGGRYGVGREGAMGKGGMSGLRRELGREVRRWEDGFATCAWEGCPV
jgi:hypothetical protein